MERSDSVGTALHWGSKGCYFESHCRLSHSVVSLSKTLYLLLSSGSTQENCLDITEKLLTGM